MEDDDRSIPLVEPEQDGVHELSVAQGIRGVPGDQGMEIGHLDLDRTATSTPCLVEAGVHGQAMQPRLETVRIAQAPEIAPGAEQGVLDRVARELRVPDDQAGRRVQPRDRAFDELGEGVMIASPRAFDELSLVHGPSQWGSQRDCLGA